MNLTENESSEIRRVCDDSGIPWESLHEKHIVITGATGLIGSALAKSLLGEYNLPFERKAPLKGEFSSFRRLSFSAVGV